MGGEYSDYPMEKLNIQLMNYSGNINSDGNLSIGVVYWIVSKIIALAFIE
jgi:hypothetical protein